MAVLSGRSLRIHNIDHSDYGEYKCVASNPLGIDQQVMYLYGTYVLFAVATTTAERRQRVPTPYHFHRVIQGRDQNIPWGIAHSDGEHTVARVWGSGNYAAS